MKIFIYIFLLLIVIGCESYNGKIETGEFEIYEKDSLVGKIYRLGNYQIEKYPKSELIAKIEYLTDSTYLIKGTEKIQKGNDSIEWLNTYKKLGKNKYEIVIKPFNSNIEYEYRGILIKTKNQIPKKYLVRLKVLNEK